MATLQAIQSLTLTLQSTPSSIVDQLDVFINLGHVDDDFKVGMYFFTTPDGKGARIVFYHVWKAQSPEGIKQVPAVTAAAEQALEGTSLSNAKIYLAGAASNYRDVKDYSRNDIIIMLATFALVFAIVLAITRAAPPSAWASSST